MYNWSEYFEEQTIKNCIERNHSNAPFQSSPGVVFVQSESSGLERKINLLKNTSWVPLADDLPSLIIPSGLSAERKQYLFDKIREFCHAEKRN